MTLALTSLARSVAASEPDPTPQAPHRIGAGVGVGATYASADEDGHWREGSGAPGFALDYAYAVHPIFDVGATLRYWNFGAFSNGSAGYYNRPDDGIHHGFLPGVFLRAHTTARMQFGGTLGAGALVLSQRAPDGVDYNQVRTHTWLGWQTSLSLDARFWVTRHWAFQLGPMLAFGVGNDQTPQVGYYLRREAALLTLGLWLGGVFAP